MDQRIQRIFEAWFDYDYAPNEDTKIHCKEIRNKIIKEFLNDNTCSSSVGDFLAVARDSYRNWAIKEKLHNSHRRF